MRTAPLKSSLSTDYRRYQEVRGAPRGQGAESDAPAKEEDDDTADDDMDDDLDCEPVGDDDIVEDQDLSLKARPPSSLTSGAFQAIAAAISTTR